MGFEQNWYVPGSPLPESQSEVNALLNAQGWLEHWPKPNRRTIYRLKKEDVDRIPSRSFIASWGASQPVAEGDYLAWNDEEIYLMPPTVLSSTYAECKSDIDNPVMRREKTNWDLCENRGDEDRSSSGGTK